MNLQAKKSFVMVDYETCSPVQNCAIRRMGYAQRQRPLRIKLLNR